MRTRLSILLAACSFAAFAAPAQAALVGASNIDFANQDFTFQFGTGSFTFGYSPSGTFDFDPVTIRTAGSGAVTAFGGFLGIPLAPSTFFPRANASIGPDTAPGFASFTTPTTISGSIVSSDLGLRVNFGGDDYFGYARFAGSMIDSIAFETRPNTAITAGSLTAVPEPATWAMMIAGVGMVGGAMRRKRAMTVRVAYA